MKNIEQLKQELHNRRTAVTIGLIGIVGVHLADLPAKWKETRYIAWMYIGAIAFGLFLIDRLVVKTSKRDYLASSFLSISVLLGYVVNRSVGMPGAKQDIGNWFEPLGFLSIVIELFAVWHSVYAYRTIAQVEKHKSTK
jgi:phosphoglycerol transferase MdoB-like AlkP superfamily enzyme